LFVSGGSVDRGFSGEEHGSGDAVGGASFACSLLKLP
jgi:hypothetical protein